MKRKHRDGCWGFSLDQIEEVFQQSKELVCFMELGGRLSRVNSRWKATLGWEEEELTEGEYIRFIHPDDVEKTLEHESHFIPTGFYNRWRCKDGSYRYLSWTGLPIIGSDSGPTFSIVHDVTLEILLRNDREKQIKILNEQVQFNSAVARAVADIQKLYLGPLASLWDEDALKPVVNHFVLLTESRYGLLIQGVEKDQVRSSLLSLQQQHALASEQLLQAENLLEQAARSHQPVSATIGTQSFLAVPLLVAGQVVAILGLANRPGGYPVYLIEWLDPLLVLTTRLVNERNMATARTKAEQASQSKSAFLAHMSHELRTPLGGIIGLLDLINKDTLSAEDHGYLTMAEDAGQSLLTILNDILDLSKIEADQLQLEEVDFQPQAVIQDVIQLLSFQAKRKGIQLVLHMDPAIPSILRGDPTRLRQILLNLTSNALKFTEHGSVTIFLRGSQTAQAFVLQGKVQPVGEVLQNYTLDATVQDTGIGMTPETIDGLFRAFVQGDRSTSRRFGGTGLGLFICKRLCALMGGDIVVSSHLGEGSLFHFKVSLHIPPYIPVATNDALSESESLPPLRVLVADDNPMNQLILKSMLQRNGCASVQIATNGEQAVKAALSSAYDLVLMDVQMPVVDGLEATKRIRQAHSTVPVIGVSAHAMTGDRETALACGMNGYVSKPVAQKELLKEIHRCLALVVPAI